MTRRLKRERGDGAGALARCVKEMRMKGMTLDLAKEPQRSKQAKSSCVEIKWREQATLVVHAEPCRHLSSQSASTESSSWPTSSSIDPGPFFPPTNAKSDDRQCHLLVAIGPLPLLFLPFSVVLVQVLTIAAFIVPPLPLHLFSQDIKRRNSKESGVLYIIASALAKDLDAIPVQSSDSTNHQDRVIPSVPREQPEEPLDGPDSLAEASTLESGGGLDGCSRGCLL